jgi:hypothetical protein
MRFSFQSIDHRYGIPEIDNRSKGIFHSKERGYVREDKPVRPLLQLKKFRVDADLDGLRRKKAKHFWERCRLQDMQLDYYAP